MTAPIPVPTSIACATCGKPLNALTCYSVSVPLDGPVKPVDVCDLYCLDVWLGTEDDSPRPRPARA